MLGVLILAVSVLLWVLFVRWAWRSPLRPVLEWLLWALLVIGLYFTIRAMNRTVGELFGNVGVVLLIGVPGWYVGRWWRSRRAPGGAR